MRPQPTPRGWRSDFWTPERVRILRTLWGTIPARVIGERLGVTKNAVIGKANRLGLARQPTGKPSRFRWPTQPQATPLVIIGDATFIKPPTRAQLMGRRA